MKKMTKNKEIFNKKLMQFIIKNDRFGWNFYSSFYLNSTLEAARHLQHLMPMSRFAIEEEVPVPKLPKLQMDTSCNRRLLLGRKMNRSLSNTDFWKVSPKMKIKKKKKRERRPHAQTNQKKKNKTHTNLSVT